MTHHPRTGPASSPLAGLFARLRERFLARLAGRERERGDVLVEAIIFMGVISIVAGAYTTSSASANQVARSMTAIDIVDQQGQGVLEQAQVQPWETLGFNWADHTYKDGAKPTRDPIDGLPIVTHTEADRTPGEVGSVQPYLPEVITRGIKMQQTTYITWVDNPAGTAAGAYGTKKITVVIKYHTPGVLGTQTKTYSTTRTATPSEAVPTNVSSIDDARNSNGGNPLSTSCPKVYLEYFDGDERLRWDPVSGASGYHVRSVQEGVDRDIPSSAPVQGAMLNLDAAVARTDWSTYDFAVEPVVGGLRVACTPVEPLGWSREKPPCPTGVIFQDAMTLSWAHATDADSYVVVQRIGSAETQVGSTTAHSFTLAERPTGSEFQVRAVNSAGTSPSCTFWTIATPAPPTPTPTPTPDPVPACPTGVRFLNSTTIAWQPVSGATSYVVMQRAPSSPSSARPFTEVSGASTSTATVTNATGYEWQVLAKNASGTSINCGTWLDGRDGTSSPICGSLRAERGWQSDVIDLRWSTDFTVNLVTIFEHDSRGTRSIGTFNRNITSTSITRSTNGLLEYRMDIRFNDGRVVSCTQWAGVNDR